MVVAVGEPNLAREILLDSTSSKARKTYEAFDLVTNNTSSLASRNGEYWHSRRKGMAAAFSSRYIKRMNDVACKKVDEWIDNKLSSMIKKEAFDVGKEMIDITLSTICETGFEYKMSDEEKKVFSQLDLALREFILKTALNPFRAYFSIYLSDRCRAHLATKRIH